MWGFLPLTTLLLFSTFTATYSEEKKDEGAIVRARLETCGGWRLNSLPEVKAFIRELLPHYHDVRIRYIPGKDPAMVFLNADNKVVLEEDVSEKRKEEISQLLETHGLLKSEEARSHVPEDPYEEEPEPDEPWDEEEDREGDEEEEEEEGPETAEEDDEDDDDDDATQHIEL